MEKGRTRPRTPRAGLRRQRPPVARTEQRRLRQHVDDRLLRLVPPLLEPVHIAASADAQETARALVANARAEALEQGRLAIEHAQRQVELLRLAAMTESVIDA